MLIERKALATRILTFRTDEAAYQRLRELSRALNVSPSVAMRLAVSTLLRKQERVRATTLRELLNDGA